MFKILGKIVFLLLIHAGLQLSYMLFVSVYILWQAGEELDTVDLMSRMMDHVVVAILYASIASFIIYYFLYRLRGKNLIEICRFKRIKKYQVAASVMIGFGYVIVASFALAFLSTLFPSLFESTEDLFVWIDTTHILLLIISVGLVGPILEEILFRGLIFELLNREVPLTATLLLQALLFGLYHMNLVQGINTFVFANIIGLALIWTGSILTPIIIHIINNIFAVLTTVPSIEKLIIDMPTVFLILCGVMAVVMLGFGLAMLYQNRVVFYSIEHNQKVDSKDYHDVVDLWTRENLTKRL